MQPMQLSVSDDSGRWRLRSAVAAVAVLMVALGASVMMSPGDATAQEGKPNCRGSLQGLIDAAKPGSTVRTPGNCVYRERVVINKPLTLAGGRGAEIRGSNVWRNWRKSGNYWIKGGLPKFPASGQCKSGTKRCLWPAQVFLDGRPLLQVASRPAKGQFAVKTSARGRRHIMLADNPGGHTVEVSIRQQWVVGKADNVTISGFTMRNAANSRERGALTNADSDNPYYFHSYWTVKNNRLSNAAAAVVVLKGKHNKLIGNDIKRGGQLGVHLGGNYNLIQGNKIHNNNTEDFDPGWEAGGIKAAARVKGLTVTRNHIYDNRGVGAWCDIDCSGVSYTGNRIYNNAGAGILFEISQGANIAGNVVWNNGWHQAGRAWSAGIKVSNSRNVRVHGNVVAWNASGISVISTNRDNARWNKVYGIKIHNNDLLAKNGYSLAWIQEDGWNGGVLYNRASDNRGMYNHYWYPGPEKSSISNWNTDLRYRWGDIKHVNHNILLKLRSFSGTPGERSGRYLTQAQKRRVVSSARIPANPPRH